MRIVERSSHRLATSMTERSRRRQGIRRARLLGAELTFGAREFAGCTGGAGRNGGCAGPLGMGAGHCWAWGGVNRVTRSGYGYSRSCRSARGVAAGVGTTAGGQLTEPGSAFSSTSRPRPMQRGRSTGTSPSTPPSCGPTSVPPAPAPARRRLPPQSEREPGRPPAQRLAGRTATRLRRRPLREAQHRRTSHRQARARPSGRNPLRHPRIRLPRNGHRRSSRHLAPNVLARTGPSRAGGPGTSPAPAQGSATSRWRAAPPRAHRARPPSYGT